MLDGALTGTRGGTGVRGSDAGSGRRRLPCAAYCVDDGDLVGIGVAAPAVPGSRIVMAMAVHAAAWPKAGRKALS